VIQSDFVKRWVQFRRYLRLVVVLVVTSVLLYSSSPVLGGPSDRVRAFTREIEFDFIDWTLDALRLKLFESALGTGNYLPQQERRQLVLDYLKVVAQIQEGELWLSLPAWAGFSSGPGSKISKGEVGVSVSGDAMDAEEIGPEQRAAYRRIVGRASAAQRMVLDAIADAFPKLTKGAAIELPKKVDRAELESLVTLVAIHIHWAHRDKVAYLGYELRCAWDTEHGVGVMTHQDRVVAVGQADTAILGWLAERDRKKSKS